MKIFSYIPYVTMTPHSVLTLTVLHALVLRGHEVGVLGCDQAYPICSLDQPSMGFPRTEEVCRNCFKFGQNLLRSFPFQFGWVGRFIDSGTRAEVSALAEHTPLLEMQDVTFRGMPVGQWALSTVETAFRVTELTPGHDYQHRFFRDSIRHVALAAVGMGWFLETWKPDVLFIFNGRMDSMRVALELGRRAGIKVICEDRIILGRSRLCENTNIVSLAPMEEAWEKWKDIPLSSGELDELTALVTDRIGGRDINTRVFADSATTPEAIRQRFGLDPAKPVWVLFTTAPEEGAYTHIPIQEFRDHRRWVSHVLSHVAGRSDVQLIIRAHPSYLKRGAAGANLQQIEYIDSIIKDPPPNVRIIPSDDTSISSYGLMWIADLVLHYLSTTGLEAAMFGKAVLQPHYIGTSAKPFALNYDSIKIFDQILHGLQGRPENFDHQSTAIMAWRYAYCYFFRASVLIAPIKFKSFYVADFAYDHESEILPGCHPELDAICRKIVGEEPVIPGPVAADFARDPSLERAAVAKFAAACGV